MLLVLMISCKKADDDWIPTGSNTFSCKVDGQMFAPKESGGVFSSTKPLHAGYDRRRKLLLVEAERSSQQVSFYLSNLVLAGKYSLGFTSLPYPASTSPISYGIYVQPVPGPDPYNQPPPIRYYTDSVYAGTVQIVRFDTLARIAGGTFEFVARESATGKLVRITDGRFDVRF
ncbi:hypothetical protein [Hymenobacter koreensis]|uniref:hypothetical protein n=1 Tax=Hymenobacter koreensis TaxID=1084523 RepID=UPI0031EFA94C